MKKEDWVECKLCDIGAIYSGGTPRTNKSEFWGDEISWITPADLSDYTSKYISRGRKSITKLGLNKSSAKLLPAGSVVYSSRAPIGYVAIAQNELATNQGFKSIVPISIIFNEYVYYYFRSIKTLAENAASGTTFKELSKATFATLPFKFPALPEQRAIVAKIEQLFSALDNGVAEMKKAREQLKIYRQAVLKKAFTGELTNLIVSKMPLSEFAILITKGSSPRWQGFNYVDDKNQLLFITSENVREGYMDYSKEKYIQHEFNIKEKKSILKKGDLLFNLVGASIGRAAIFTLDRLANINQAVAIIRLKDSMSAQFLNYYMNSEVAKQDYLNKRVDVARANLSLKDVNELRIPVCTIGEQKQIVQEIESRLSVCDKVEQIIAESLAKAEALRQSILKKAFEGRLLSEAELEACRKEKDYEPASELLIKIKAEKLRNGEKK